LNQIRRLRFIRFRIDGLCELVDPLWFEEVKELAVRYSLHSQTDPATFKCRIGEIPFLVLQLKTQDEPGEMKRGKGMYSKDVHFDRSWNYQLIDMSLFILTHLVDPSY